MIQEKYPFTLVQEGEAEEQVQRTFLGGRAGKGDLKCFGIFKMEDIRRTFFRTIKTVL